MSIMRFRLPKLRFIADYDRLLHLLDACLIPALDLPTDAALRQACQKLRNAAAEPALRERPNLFGAELWGREPGAVRTTGD